MLFASLLFAAMNIIVKFIPNIPVAQIVFMRSLVMFIMVVGMLKKRRLNPWGNRKGLLLMRGFFGSLGIAFFFYTLQNMPLASAVTVHYLTPIFTALIAFIFAGERLKPVQWFFFLICFVGVVLIKGYDPRVEWGSILIGVLGTIAAASAYNIISYLKGTEHHLVIMFYFPSVTIPLVLIYIFITGDWVWGSAMEWLALSAIGMLTYFAQYFLTRSYQDGRVNKVSIISYFGIFYALGFGWLFFGEWYNLQALGGLALVVLGVVMNLLVKDSK
ncbi:DMT family transporter [bacterium]|nr:DMT family transporter [bacterium]